MSISSLDGVLIEPGADLSFKTARWIDLTGANLSGANLSNINLENVLLTGADLSYANLN